IAHRETVLGIGPRPAALAQKAFDLLLHLIDVGAFVDLDVNAPDAIVLHLAASRHPEPRRRDGNEHDIVLIAPHDRLALGCQHADHLEWNVPDADRGADRIFARENFLRDRIADHDNLGAGTHIRRLDLTT